MKWNLITQNSHHWMLNNNRCSSSWWLNMPKSVHFQLHWMRKNYSSIKYVYFIYIYMYIYIYMEQGCTNPGCQVTWAAKFFIVALNICGSPVWNVLQVTLLVLRILKSHLDFWKICALLIFMVIICGCHTSHHYDETDRHPMVLVTCCTYWIHGPEVFLSYNYMRN